jgi:hypothetical protein
MMRVSFQNLIYRMDQFIVDRLGYLFVGPRGEDSIRIVVMNKPKESKSISPRNG